MELACARGLTRDQWELAVDEAIEYLVPHYDVPIYSAVQIYKELRLGIGDVRSAEASIKRELERFSAIMAAGSLCTHREAMVAAYGTGVLTERAERTR